MRRVVPLLNLVDAPLKALRKGQVGQGNRVPTVIMYELRWPLATVDRGIAALGNFDALNRA